MANSAKAREKVASLGTDPAPSQPHRRRRVGSTLSRSTSARVVGMSSTAFARKARASAARSCSGRPRQPQLYGSDSSTRTSSTTRTSRW